MKVLVVDDSGVMRKVIVRSFERGRRKGMRRGCERRRSIKDFPGRSIRSDFDRLEYAREERT